MLFNKDFLYFRGRIALSELLRASGIGTDDLVAIQAYTCSAVPEAVYNSLSKPLFIDVVDLGITMCPKDLNNKLKKNDNVKAIVIQHTFGVVANIDEICSIAKRYNLIIIEDCCHSFSSEWNGVKVGSFSDASFYSFEWGKPIALGLGGALSIHNKFIEKNIRLQYQSFINPPFKTEVQIFIQRLAFLLIYRPSTYWLVKKSFNYLSKIGLLKGNHSEYQIGEKSEEFKWRMAKVIRSILNSKMELLSDFENHSQTIVAQYENTIFENSSIKRISQSDSSKNSYVRYPIWVNDKKEIISKAYLNKIEIASWYSTPVHPFDHKDLLNIGYEEGSCPNAELACAHVISLPISKNVNEAFINKVNSLFGSLNA